MILIDKFITAGKTHFMCQDYIISGKDYIILSDGCSGAKDSDVGARILTHVAANFLKNWKDRRHYIEYYKMGLDIIYNAQVVARLLHISEECLAATLIIAFVENDEVNIFIYGDGYVISVDDEGVSYDAIFYTNNRPFYLSYHLNPNYIKLCESLNEVQIVKRGKDLQTRNHNEPVHWKYKLDKDHLRTVAIASDGIGSFSSKPLINDIVKECVIFKQTNGMFLQRRMNRMLLKHQNQGCYNNDDISIGAFHRDLDERRS